MLGVTARWCLRVMAYGVCGVVGVWIIVMISIASEISLVASDLVTLSPGRPPLHPPPPLPPVVVPLDLLPWWFSEPWWVP